MVLICSQHRLPQDVVILNTAYMVCQFGYHFVGRTATKLDTLGNCGDIEQVNVKIRALMTADISKIVNFEARTVMVLADSLVRPIANGVGHDSIQDYLDDPTIVKISKLMPALFRYTSEITDTVTDSGQLAHTASPYPVALSC